MPDEIRYELDHAGNVVEHDSALCADLDTMIQNLFSQFGNSCTIVEKNGSLRILSIVNPTGGQRVINVFCGRIRNEKRSPHEKKIQLGLGVDPRRYPKSSTLIIGVYVFEETDGIEDAVFVGFPIDDHTDYPTNPSLRGGLSTNQLLADAKSQGIFVDKNSNLCGFRAEFIYFYLSNHEIIHYPERYNDDALISDGNDYSALSKNRILFGAPGTGKSFRLNKEATELDKDYIRVTFHPDYSYSQFVGSYKPHVVNGDVIFRYVPGPFTEVYLKAIKDPANKHLLIIEEINRANPSAVFGEVFQLLDRSKEGSSEFPVKPSLEMREFLSGEVANSCPEDRLSEITARYIDRLSIPSNMYIWATMNSADQGVYPMDTAFKRRWDMNYISIDNNEEKVDEYWNSLRKMINYVLSGADVNEDKLLGPFFIHIPKGMCLDASEEESFYFRDQFKNKVLMYLFEDAAKYHKEIFRQKGDRLTLSKLFEGWDEGGSTKDKWDRIFDDDFSYDSVFEATHEANAPVDNEQDSVENGN